MSIPKIVVINFTTDISDRKVQHIVRAVNRQIIEDFMPIWGVGRELQLQASSFTPTLDEDILKEDIVRGSAAIYLVDQATVAGALGYHALNNAGVPYGFVYTDLSNGDDWSVTLSHEALELVLDPNVNALIIGPDPEGSNDTVLHTYEVCDAVERTSYFIDEVEVSNFVTPAYFTIGDELGTRNDFLGIGVESFNALQNCHLAYLHLNQGWKTFYGHSELKISKAKKEFIRSDCKDAWPDDETLDEVVLKNANNTIQSMRRTGRHQKLLPEQTLNR